MTQRERSKTARRAVPRKSPRESADPSNTGPGAGTANRGRPTGDRSEGAAERDDGHSREDDTTRGADWDDTE